MAAAVLQMAVLAGARVEQRPEPVRGVGRGRRRDPVLAEDAVADLEVELALEIHIAGGKREGVRRVGRAARGGLAARLASPGSSLVKSVVGASRLSSAASVPAPISLQAPASSGRAAPKAMAPTRARAARLPWRCFLRLSAMRSRNLEWGECTRPSSEADAGARPQHGGILDRAVAVGVGHVAAGLEEILEIRLHRPAGLDLVGVADLDQRLVIARDRLIKINVQAMRLARRCRYRRSRLRARRRSARGSCR